jgi:hypothetical protein
MERSMNRTGEALSSDRSEELKQKRDGANPIDMSQLAGQ